MRPETSFFHMRVFGCFFALTTFAVTCHSIPREFGDLDGIADAIVHLPRSEEPIDANDNLHDQSERGMR